MRAHELHAACDPESLGFETTESVEPLDGVLGQDEAMDALRFGIEIDSPGFNVFVLGRPGSGRHTFVREALDARATQLPPPPDWCYTADFHDPRRARILELPSGAGPELRDDMESLTAELRDAIPSVLDSEDVVGRRAAIAEDFGLRANEVMRAFREDVEADDRVTLVGEADAMSVAPARGGEALTREAFEALDEDVRKATEEHVRDATRRLMAVQREIHRIRQKAHSRVGELHVAVTERLVHARLEVLRTKYEGIESVIGFVQEVADDVVRHVGRFTLPMEIATDPSRVQALFGESQEDFFRRYQVNPVVTRDREGRAPVVEESNPNLRNLQGRMEGQVRFGVMVTDFTRIAPGALHRAQGGFLVLDAEEVLSRPLTWPSLKRVLRTGELRPADPAAEVGLLVTESLDPDPIPVDVKVVLVGRPRTYYLLQSMDPDFAELFKVKVDFAPDMDRSPETERDYAAFVAGQCQKGEIPPFDASAVARLVEKASRIAHSQTKLTTRFRGIVDVIQEAAHRARSAGRDVVGRDDVDEALERRAFREARPHRQILDMIERGALAFDPEGTAVGQLHGIGLLALNDRAFGRPMRVMASAYAGTRGVIAIEREASMSGPIHSKGVLILQGYLGRHFARREPLILSASLSFDQLYEEVEGDSASVAELYALMSAIGDVPLRQDVGVTGALNQEGHVLPVGGVTQKVEGFFDACRVVGFTGTQGVMLPRQNEENLVLRRDVRTAVEAGRFHLWTIARVEEGWDVVAERPAGPAAPDGSFPEGTVHHAVARQLARWREGWKEAREGASPDPGVVVVRGEGEDEGRPGSPYPDVPEPGDEGPEPPASG